MVRVRAGRDVIRWLLLGRVCAPAQRDGCLRSLDKPMANAYYEHLRRELVRSIYAALEKRPGSADARLLVGEAMSAVDAGELPDVVLACLRQARETYCRDIDAARRRPLRWQEDLIEQLDAAILVFEER